MSEEVNLSEESNNPEEDVLDQVFLLEKVDEMRDLIHQQRFTECKPILVYAPSDAWFAENRSRQHESLAVQEVA